MATQIIFGRLLPKTLTSLTSFRALSTSATIVSLVSLVERLNHSPNSSALKLRNGCDYYRNDVIMQKRDDLKQTKVEIIHDYVKALADLVGSEEEARMMVYSYEIDNEDYNSFGKFLSDELYHKVEGITEIDNEHGNIFGTLLSNELYPRVEALPGVSMILRMDYWVNNKIIDEIVLSRPLDLDLLEKKVRTNLATEEEFSRLLLTKQGIFAA